MLMKGPLFIGGQDYTPLMTGVTFSKSKSFNSIVIPIHDDRQLELAESFSISLSHSEGESVLILPAESTIWILDNDGMSPLTCFKCVHCYIYRGCICMYVYYPQKKFYIPSVVKVARVNFP